jgi:MarR family transcriptional regulator, organic hydroperoxide resistance regulator
MTKKQSPYCQCLHYSANALARVITKMAEEEFAVTGLAPSYAFLLMAVNSNPGIHAGELAELMMLTPSTVSRLIEKMEGQSLLKRVNEGRTTLIFPTPASVELNEKIKTAWLSLYNRYIAVLGEEEATLLTSKIYNAALLLEKN